jgi:hypothetical protein
MIGLERMLHAEQKTQPQNSEHPSPAPHPTTPQPYSRHPKAQSGEAVRNSVIPGWRVSARPQMRNCASGNPEIPGSMLRIAPE